MITITIHRKLVERRHPLDVENRSRVVAQRVADPKSRQQEQGVEHLLKLLVDFLFAAEHRRRARTAQSNVPPTQKIAKKMRVAAGGRPLVVGVVHSPETLQAALALPPAPAAPDWLELRVDAFSTPVAELDELLAASPRPLLVTVRRPDEGGLNPVLEASRRAELYAEFLPVVAAIDVEVRSLAELGKTVDAARAAGVLVVASYHDFTGTPPLSDLLAAARLALAAGAEVFKVATTAKTSGDLAVLFQLLDAAPDIVISAMGMGRLGRASRPALAAAGSALNYGYLGDAPQVPGQWPVAALRTRIDELCN